MRRTRIAYVLPEDIISTFLYEGTGFPTLRKPHSTNVLRRLRFVGVPADCTIDGHVQYDFLRQAFAFLIEHPSFDEVPFGDVPPTIETHVETFYCDQEGKEIKQPTHDGWFSFSSNSVYEPGTGSSTFKVHGNTVYSPSDVVPDLMAEAHVGSFQHRDVELGKLKALNDSGVIEAGLRLPDVPPAGKIVNGVTVNPFDKTWRDKPSLL